MAESDPTTVIENFESAPEEKGQPQESKERTFDKEVYPAHVLQAQERAWSRQVKTLEDQIESMKAQLAEHAPRKRESEMEKAIAEARKKWEVEELKPREQKLEEWQNRFRQTNLKSAIIAAKVREDVNVDHVATVLNGYFRESEDFGTVLYEGDRPVVNPNGTPDSPYMGFTEGVKYLASKPEFKWAFKPSSMVGSPDYAGGTNGRSEAAEGRVTKADLKDLETYSAWMQKQRDMGDPNPVETFRNLPRE